VVRRRDLRIDDPEVVEREAAAGEAAGDVAAKPRRPASTVPMTPSSIVDHAAVHRRQAVEERSSSGNPLIT
jgi:hypothetical protein